MSAKIFDNADGQKVVKPLFFSFRRFQLFSLLVIVVIRSVVSVGLRIIFRKLVLNKAEQSAVHISAAIHDSEISQFFCSDSTQKQYFNSCCCSTINSSAWHIYLVYVCDTLCCQNDKFN